jgi:ABC-2 type transport system permease protein
VGQVALMVAVGALAFGVHFDALSLAWLTAICLLGVLTFMGVGFVIACVIKTEDLITDVISAVNMPLVLLSEIFFPLEALPRPLAVVGEWLPSTEMVRLLRNVLLYGVTEPRDLAGGIAMLAGWAVVTFAVSLAVFDWEG